MKSKMQIASLAVLLLLGAGCSHKSTNSEAVADVPSAVSTETVSASAGSENKLQVMTQQDQAQEPAAVNAAPVEQKIKIIRSGNISIESKDITASKKNMDALLKKVGGYYEQESSSSGNNYLISYNMTLRIPSRQLDNFMAAVESGKDRITEKSMSSEDVSVQYYDVESRLKSKRAYLAKYQAMVASAKSVKDLLEIQEQIRQLQEEIDSSEGILRNLSGRVEYSSLSVNLFEYQANLPMGSNSFWSRVKDSASFGWDLIVSIFLGLVGIWPFLIILAIVILLLRRYQKKRKQRFLEKNKLTN